MTTQGTGIVERFPDTFLTARLPGPGAGGIVPQSGRQVHHPSG